MAPTDGPIQDFSSRIEAEVKRIGLVETNFMRLQLFMDSPPTPETEAALLADLRAVPTGSGDRGLLKHFGLDPHDFLR